LRRTQLEPPRTEVSDAFEVDGRDQSGRCGDDVLAELGHEGCLGIEGRPTLVLGELDRPGPIVCRITSGASPNCATLPSFCLNSLMTASFHSLMGWTHPNRAAAKLRA